MWDFWDKLEHDTNSVEALTYCEYVGGKVSKSNYGCEYGNCNNCSYKKEYEER